MSPAPVRASTLALIGPINAARVLARLLAIALLALVAALIFAPWQQSTMGRGRVIAYAPLERQQQIEAPIAGRVAEWYVQEGDHVSKGDLIAELRDNDPEILDRLQRERQSIEAQIAAADTSITMYQSQIAALESVRGNSVRGAELRQDMAQDRLSAAEQAKGAASASYETSRINVERQRALHEKGLASSRQLELAELSYRTTKADLERAQAALRAAKREVEALRTDVGKTDADTRAKVESTKSALEDVKAKKAKAEAELAKLGVRVARQRTMEITAPRDGTIYRLLVNSGFEMVKAGDAIATLIPDATNHAVELWIDGNDVPLVTPGRHVRLQFEGWPAVQFVGWPAVAVGTFGGTVAFVDAQDDGKGRFRIVVVPDSVEAWPEARYLRQGVRANGWVLLNQVSLGYELWRQFNGFPPAVDPPSEGLAEPKTETAAVAKRP